MEIKTVGVVGCGLMGSGIAQVAAMAGYSVIAQEVNEQLLNKGIGYIRSSLGKGVEKGKLTQVQMDETLARIKGTTSVDDFADCDLAIEAIVENMGEKIKLYSKLDTVCRPEAILASNTSSLAVIEMAAATTRMDRVAGLHFFNPVPLMKLVEVVRTIASSDETVTTLARFGESVGKTVVYAKDTPGFIVNRLLVPYLLDAIRLLESEVATKEDVDKAMVLGTGHPMGPITLLDVIGLDTTYYIANSMFDEYREPRFAPPPLLKRMVIAGRLGKKSGRGFYEY